MGHLTVVSRASCRHYVGGDCLAGQRACFTVTNPSDGSDIAGLTGVSAHQVSSAIAAARRAFDHGRWPAMPAFDRAACLRAMIAWLDDHRPRIEDILVAEAGVVRAWPVRADQLDLPLRHAADLIEMHPRGGPSDAV